MIVRLKHVKRVRSKGRIYFYHQLTHERLPDDREERAARVLEINSTMKGTARKIALGSLADFITQYKAAPEFRNLRESSREHYSPALDLLAETWGSSPVASIERKHILALRDKYADTPAKANRVVSVLRVVLSFAMDRDDELGRNAAQGVKKLPLGPGHATWPHSAIDHFLATAPPMMALALKLGLYTGQRRGDVLRMSWNHYDGETIQVVQSKTGTKLRIPVHSALREALDGQERVSPTILTGQQGRPFTKGNFEHQFRKARIATGLERLSFHGLRYTAAARLAEAGCSLKEIAAITGHKSLQMLEKYSRDADQRQLAGAAIHRLERNVGRTQTGKLA
jgi:integrase